VLDNYKKITRILTENFLRSFDEEKKFKDRQGTNVLIDIDPEYAKF